MAQLKITAQPSPSPDVVAYRLRVVPQGQPVDYDTEYVESSDGVFLSGDVPALRMADGTFDFYLTAVDDAGNESDFTVATREVDFIPPAPPKGVLFEVA